jgi:hypothetical protein
MQITITTPALLFPAISLLLLAYTNRFLALAALMRDLIGKHKQNQDNNLLDQISNLKKRIRLIRDMQAFGAISFFLCVLSMMVLFFNKIIAGEIIFGLSLICLLISIAYSILEIQISIDALNIQAQKLTS